MGPDFGQGRLSLRLFSWLLLGLLVACSASEPPEVSPPEVCWTPLDEAAVATSWRAPWTLVGEPTLDAAGVGAEVEVRGTVFRVSGADACFQLHEVTDLDGGAWVTPPASAEDYGPYCLSCPERVSVGVGSGLYVLPSGDAGPATASRLRARVAARECSTFLPTRTGEAPASLRVEALDLADVEETRPGVVLLEVAITEGSVFHNDGAALPAGLIQALD